MPLARSLAGQHRGKGIPLEDLEQVAYAALVRAVNRFRLSHDVDFLAYAVPTIRGELKRHFRDHGWVVRPPRRVTEIQTLVVDRREALTQQWGRTPTDEELAADLGEDIQDVRNSLAAHGCFSPTSLDEPATVDSDTPRSEALAATGHDPYVAAEARIMLRPAVRRLPERDREILRMRFYEGLTQAEIGAQIGVTQTQVSRTLRRILEDLHEAIEPELAAARESA
jgi:RNA polymerase sigma-B factor